MQVDLLQALAEWLRYWTPGEAGGALFVPSYAPQTQEPQDSSRLVSFLHMSHSVAKSNFVGL